jgi:hypothetical protein
MSKPTRAERKANVEQTKASMTPADQQELIDRCVTILDREGREVVGNDRYSISNMPKKQDTFRMVTLSTDVMIKHNLKMGGITLMVQLPDRSNTQNERWSMIFRTPVAPLTRPTTTKAKFVQWGHLAAGRDVLERLRRHMVIDDLANV